MSSQSTVKSHAESPNTADPTNTPDSPDPPDPPVPPGIPASLPGCLAAGPQVEGDSTVQVCKGVILIQVDETLLFDIII